jgi:hypothetical protein
MAWPDLTLVAEGPVTHVVWSQEARPQLAPVRFAAEGNGIIRTEELLVHLAGVVDHVLERLAEAGLPKTPLAEEWTAIARADNEERDFCRTVARMGLDPYSVSDETADDVLNIAAKLPAEIVDDFFDSADADALPGAAEWARRAIPIADRAAAKAAKELRPLHQAVSSQVDSINIDVEKPWKLGYAMARQLRHELHVNDTDQFDVTPWVGLSDVSAPSNGIQGFVAVKNGRCGLVLGGRRLGAMTSRFGRARALGRALARPEQRRFILSAARAQDERVAGAFAAELLAPAEGVRLTLAAIGKNDDSALEAIARHFGVSPLLVRHQYDNQIAMSSRRSAWYV